MNKNHKYFYIVFTTLFIVSVLIYSCNKDDVLTGVVALETYVNSTSQDLQITRFMRGQPDKSFSIAKDDTLWVESSLDAGADSTASIFRADSAKVVFADGKQYFVDDTTTVIPNFLKSKRTISPSGKTHYYRYTFTVNDYNAAR